MPEKKRKRTRAYIIFLSIEASYGLIMRNSLWMQCTILISQEESVINTKVIPVVIPVIQQY